MSCSLGVSRTQEPAYRQYSPAQTPRKGDFGLTEEWRFHNAPYIAGLKPYSRRIDYADNGLNEVEKEALEWFRTYVPERTLYNWQNSAAQLVAQDLRERMNGR